jgi:hypothetical protein
MKIGIQLLGGWVFLALAQVLVLQCCTACT